MMSVRCHSCLFKALIDPYDEMMRKLKEKEKKANDLGIKLRINATPDITASLEIDKAAGNVLTGNGNGLIDVEVRPGIGLFTINGNYIISNGTYHFVALGIAKRDFSIQDGSSIRFNGDIMDSNLDINALYKTKASVGTLISDTTSTARRTVECGIAITDKLRSGNYICHLSVIRRTLLDAIGGLRPAFDGSQDHDLMLRACERADGVIHIPRVLYHWRTLRGSMSHTKLAVCLDAAARAVEESMRRNGFPGTCRVEDGVLRLRYDVGDFTVAALRLARDASAADVNRLAADSSADMLLFLWGDTAAPDADGLREMMMYAQRPDVCAVMPLVISLQPLIFGISQLVTALQIGVFFAIGLYKVRKPGSLLIMALMMGLMARHEPNQLQCHGGFANVLFGAAGCICAAGGREFAGGGLGAVVHGTDAGGDAACVYAALRGEGGCGKCIRGLPGESSCGVV